MPTRNAAAMSAPYAWTGRRSSPARRPARRRTRTTAASAAENGRSARSAARNETFSPSARARRTQAIARPTTIAAARSAAAGSASPAGTTRWKRTGCMVTRRYDGGAPRAKRGRTLDSSPRRRALLASLRRGLGLLRLAGVDDEHRDAHHDERVGDVERRPAEVHPVPPVPLDEVDHVPARDAVDEVPDRAGEHEPERELEEALVVAEPAVVAEDERHRGEGDDREERVPKPGREGAEEPPRRAGVLDVVHAPERPVHVMRLGRERLQVTERVEPAHAVRERHRPGAREHRREPLDGEVLRPLVRRDEQDEEDREDPPLRERSVRAHSRAPAHFPHTVG